MSFTDDMTLGDARDMLRSLLMDGSHCPCCHQMAKVYKRQVHAGMAATLIHMWRAAGERAFVPVYLPDLPQKSRDATGLRYWGLIMEQSERRPDGGKAGWWSVTAKGAAYVDGIVSIPRYAHVYDGRVIDHSGDARTIMDALGASFSYAELMAA